MTMPQPPAPLPAKTPWWRSTWAITLAALVIGIGIGAISSGDTPGTAEPAPGPTVTETITVEPEPAATVTVTAAPDPDPEPVPAAEDDPEDAASMDGTTARFHCADEIEAAIQWERPTSKIQVHTIAGVLAEEYRPDTDDWFIKLEVTVDSNRLNAECIVGGTEAAPVVEVQAIY